MSNRDLPSADRPATAARADLQLLVARMLPGDEAREVARAASP
jgi:hypothetical protein